MFVKVYMKLQCEYFGEILPKYNFPRTFSEIFSQNLDKIPPDLDGYLIR